MHPIETMGLRTLRRLLLAHAREPVLEIGVGTGLNLRFYAQQSLVIAVDTEISRLQAASSRIRNSPTQVVFVQGDAQSLGFCNASFETVVVTLALCSVIDPWAVISEIRRVLRLGGKLLLIEHVRTHHRILGQIQDWLNPAWRGLLGGCNLNRNTVHLILDAGFKPDYIRHIRVASDSLGEPNSR